MKKALVILLAFALVFGLVFAACSNGTTGGNKGGGEEPIGELVDTVVFDMQDASKGIVPHGIQELALGEITFPPSGAGPIAPIVKAGNMPEHMTSFAVVDNGGKKALKYVTVATWGPGFDLPNSVFSFREGDNITITGKAEGAAIDLALNIDQGNAQKISGGNRITAAGDFEVKLILTAEDIPVIEKNEQKVIRFEDRKGATTVTITQIVIEGKRPSAAPTPLAKPVIAIDEAGKVTWEPVPGAGKYKLLAAVGTGTAVTVTEPASDATSYDLATSTLAPTKYTEAAVTYNITLIAVGVPGLSTDSEPSDAKTFTKNPPAAPPLIKIKIGGVEKDAELYAVGGSFENITTSGKVVGYTFTRGAAYKASYAYLKIDLGTAKLSDFSQVKFTYAGVSGDIGYKDIELRASATEPSGEIAAPVVNKPRYDSWATTGDSGAIGKLSFGTGFQVNNTANDGLITLKVEPALVSTLTGEVYIAIYFDAAATGSVGGAGSATVHKVSDIELIAATTTAITHDVYFVTAATDGIILAITNVTDKATVSLPSPIPSTDFSSFNTGWTNLGAWKNKEGNTAFTLGTTQVVKDTVLYNTAP